MSTVKNACDSRVFLFGYKKRLKRRAKTQDICKNHRNFKFSKKRLNTFEKLLYNTNK